MFILNSMIMFIELNDIYNICIISYLKAEAEAMTGCCKQKKVMEQIMFRLQTNQVRLTSIIFTLFFLAHTHRSSLATTVVMTV